MSDAIRFRFCETNRILARDVQQCKADIKTLQQEIRDLTAVVQHLVHTVERNADNEGHEREKLLLRLELLLRSERSLPPAPAPAESDKDAHIAALTQENETLKKRVAKFEQQSQE